MSNYIIDATMRLKDEFTGNLKKVKKKISNSTKVVGRFSTALKKAASQVVALGSTLTKSLTLPLSALGTTSVVSFANFEGAMLGVKNVTRATATELKELEQLALDLASSTSKSAVECANGIEYLGLAGWDTTEIMNNYAEILRLCEATGIDLALASDLVTDSLSAYGKSAEFTTEYLNKLTLTSTNANASTQQLLESIVACGGMARNLGLNIDELSATLGILANRGIKGSEAGVALNSIFVNLLGTTSTTRSALEQLGVSVYDTQGKFIGWERLLNQLSVAMSSCTDAQRDMLAAALGGKTQLDTLLALLDGYSNEYQDLVKSMGGFYTTDELGNQITILEKMQQDYQNTILGKFEILKSQVGFIFIKVGDLINRNFGGALDYVIDKVSIFINWCKSLTEEQKKNYLIWGMILASIGPVVAIFGKITGRIAKGIKSINDFNKAVKSAGGFMKLWKSPMGLLQAKLLLIIGAISLLVGGIIYLVKNWDKLNTKTKVVITLIGTIATAILGAVAIFKIASLMMVAPMISAVGLIVALIIGLVALIVKNWEGIKTSTISIWNSIKDFFINTWNNIKDTGIFIWESIINYFTQTWENIKQTAFNIWDSVKDYFISWYENIKLVFTGVVDFIVGVFTGNWGKAWEGVKNIFKGVWDNLVNIVKTPLNIIIGLVNGVIRRINSLASFKLPNFLGGNQISLFTVPEIPKLYKGTSHWIGGTAMIHDKGAEVVDLPNGSRVYPHDKSLKMAYESGKSDSVNNFNIKIADTVTIREDADIDRIIDVLVAKLELARINMA